MLRKMPQGGLPWPTKTISFQNLSENLKISRSPCGLEIFIHFCTEFCYWLAAGSNCSRNLKGAGLLAPTLKIVIE